MSKCLGCGVELQTTNPDFLGYIPESKLKNKLCVRCFKKNNYNKLQEVDLDYTNQIIDLVTNSKTFCFFLIDILNFKNEYLNTFLNIKNPKCLIISKVDILPKNIRYQNIKTWLEKTYKINSPILFISAKTNFNINSLTKIMAEYHQNKAFVLGYTNAGKSTLLNSLTSSNLTTSHLPNTTLGLIKISLNNNYTVIDTPGLISKNDNYQKSLLEKMAKTKYLKQYTYPLKKKTSLVIDKYYFQVEEDTTLIIYTSPYISLKKVYKDSLINKKSSIITLDKEMLLIPNIGFLRVTKKTQLSIYPKLTDLIIVPDLFICKE